MTRSTQFKKLAALAGIASAVALSSCTLPPEQAWRKIRTDGLIAYWSYELGSPYAEPRVKRVTPPNITTPSTQTQYVQTTPRPTLSPMNQPGMMENTGRTLTAQSIPALPGFVRSPYTNPPRLVDVKGATPGSTMICPYTQRPFIIPGDYVDGSGTLAAETPRPTPRVTERESSSPPAPKKSANKSENLPKVVVNNNNNRSNVTEPTPPPVVTPEPKSKPAPSLAPAPDKTASVTPSAPPTSAPQSSPKAVQDIPFGSAIPGRPGFVNSPFAAKHQLVDVTGLPAGMEVKCPYTGKLFRVPPQDMVSSKPTETAPLASPEEPKKK